MSIWGAAPPSLEIQHGAQSVDAALFAHEFDRATYGENASDVALRSPGNATNDGHAAAINQSGTFAPGIFFPQSGRNDVDRTQTAAGVPATRILGVPVSTINIAVAVNTILTWVDKHTSQYICVRDVHGIMLGQNDPALTDIHLRAGLITPDGMPLVWILKARGYKHSGRVCGADLVAALCQASQGTGARHYLYGGKPGVGERMAAELVQLFPALQIVGCSTPPFRPLTPDEDALATAQIAATQPDIVWIGLSTPKQEYWMRDHLGRIPGATLIGVGAAFDFYAGDVKRAPSWMQGSGLEWLHRLISEPRRLWRRYLILAPNFVFLVCRNKMTRALKRRQASSGD